MITAQRHSGQRKPSSLFTSWHCWILRLPGLKSGWCVPQIRKLVQLHFWITHHCYFGVLSCCTPTLTLCSVFPLCMSVYISQHGYYSRTVVLRLLEGKYRSLVSDSLRNQYHCVAPLYFRGV